MGWLELGDCGELASRAKSSWALFSFLNGHALPTFGYQVKPLQSINTSILSTNPKTKNVNRKLLKCMRETLPTQVSINVFSKIENVNLGFRETIINVVDDIVPAHCAFSVGLSFLCDCKNFIKSFPCWDVFGASWVYPLRPCIQHSPTFESCVLLSESTGPLTFSFHSDWLLEALSLGSSAHGIPWPGSECSLLKWHPQNSA